MIAKLVVRAVEFLYLTFPSENPSPSSLIENQSELHAPSFAVTRFGITSMKTATRGSLI